MSKPSRAGVDEFRVAIAELAGLNKESVVDNDTFRVEMHEGVKDTAVVYATVRVEVDASRVIALAMKHDRLRPVL